MGKYKININMFLLYYDELISLIKSFGLIPQAVFHLGPAFRCYLKVMIYLSLHLSL